MDEEVIARLRELQSDRANLLADHTDKLAEIESQIQVLQESTVHTLRNEIEERLNMLASLGVHLQLAESSVTQFNKMVAKDAAAGKICTICNFGTNPPHNYRHHGGYPNKKKPFTESQLAGKGWAKIE